MNLLIKKTLNGKTTDFIRPQYGANMGNLWDNAKVDLSVENSLK